MRGRGVQLLLQRMQNVLDIIYVHDAAMGVQHLDEPAHVRALELLRQVHKQPDRRHGILERMRLVPNLDRKAQATHPDLIDAQFPVVPLALLVVQLGPRPRRFSIRARPSRSLSHFEHIGTLP